MTYIRNIFYKKAHISSAVVSTIEFIVNLDALTIIKIIIKKYGMNYLLNYIFLIGLL